MAGAADFRITGLDPALFAPFFEFNDEELRARGAVRCIADSRPGFPCRVSLQDANVGETVVLLTFEHHPVDGPYKASGPIYVRAEAKPASLAVNEVPQVVRGRLMSVRAFRPDGWMVASAVEEGSSIEKQIRLFFENEEVGYLHLHNAKPGCFSCRVDRA